MAQSRRDSDEPEGPTGRFADDMIGLDPHDPEVQAFADHLDRMEHSQSRATVEGMLQGVGEFAQSANRTGGGRRLLAVSVVVLMLIGVALTVWNALGFMFTVFFG